MGPIEDAIRDKLFFALFGAEETNSNFQKILVHSVKHGGFGIPEPLLPTEIAYNTSKAAIEELVDSILGGTNLNYVGHRACVYGASAGAINDRKHVQLA